MKPHGDGGAYVGGDWVPIEECGKEFLCTGQRTSCATCTKGCPRSRSRTTAAKNDGSYDVVIIGAGGIGACIARELSKTTARVLILEGADDVTQGATKGNSGIIHAGYDDKPGSVRAKFCPTGCRMFPQLDRELHFGFQKNTTLVVARNAEEEATLQRLMEQGKKNGVNNLRIIDREEVMQREPNVNPNTTKALLAEDAGTIIPYEYCVALAENAVDNGVELRIRRQVTAIEKKDDGFEVTAMHWEPQQSGTGISMQTAAMAVVLGLGAAAIGYALGGLTSSIVSFALAVGAVVAKALGSSTTSSTTVSVEPSKGTIFSGPAVPEKIRTKYVVNAAGCYSDVVANMVGDQSFKVKERYGDYILLHKREGKRVSATIFPCPDPVKGKGVLVQATIWGNLILGPTARDKADSQKDSPEQILHYIISKCRELVPSFNVKEVIHTFCGARAKTTRGDWIIEPCPTAPNMIHAAGIDSPGLAASPAIALEVVRLLKEAGAPVTTPNPTFNPLRAPIVIPKKGMKDALGNAIRMGPTGSISDPKTNVVCKCEKVTEAEIVEALHRSLPIDSTQAIRRRTRAGMGHCQGDPNNYCCEDRVAEIIARENGTHVRDVQRRPWPASSIMPKRFFSDADREWVVKSGEDAQ